MVNNQNEDNLSSCSESTNEVFFEMLGLPVMDVAEFSSAVDEGTRNETGNSSLVQASPTTYHQRKQPATVSFLEVPQRCSRYLHKPLTVAAFIIEDLLTISECHLILRLAEELSATGFHYVTEASHIDNEGAIHKVKLQEPNKHKLSVFEHEETTIKLWNALEPALQPHVDKFVRDTQSGPMISLNPRLRVLRYDASDNDVFDPHFDATTRITAADSDVEMTSLLTVLLYLNEGGGSDFGGGETFYLDSINANTKPTKVVPSTGSAVVFEHDLFHSSEPLTFGTKFVLRTDILFKLEEQSAVDRPRRIVSDKMQHGCAKTFAELCKSIKLCEEANTCLEEIGLMDLTIESMMDAPGIIAVKQMIFDVLSEENAAMVANALTPYCRQQA